MYRIIIVKKAEDDLSWFRKNDKSSYIKSFDLTGSSLNIQEPGRENLNALSTLKMKFTAAM
jgi:hypothetical protein